MIVADVIESYFLFHFLVGILLCVIMRASWGAPISVAKYWATLFLWPYIIYLGFRGKLS